MKRKAAAATTPSKTKPPTDSRPVDKPDKSKKPKEAKEIAKQEDKQYVGCDLVTCPSFPFSLPSNPLSCPDRPFMCCLYDHSSEEVSRVERNENEGKRTGGRKITNEMQRNKVS
jgi:hypothetical protein